MTSRTTARFRQCLADLPENVRRQAREAYHSFAADPHRPGLRLKRVHETEPIYSVRINLDCRALGVRDGDDMIWFWIGSHVVSAGGERAKLGHNLREV